jgi:hypothetical protein
MKFITKKHILFTWISFLFIEMNYISVLYASLLPPIRLDYADREVGTALKHQLTMEFNFPDSFIEEKYVENVVCHEAKFNTAYTQWYLCVDQKGVLFEIYRNPTFVEKTIKAFYGK